MGLLVLIGGLIENQSQAKVVPRFLEPWKFCGYQRNLPTFSLYFLYLVHIFLILSFIKKWVSPWFSFTFTLQRNSPCIYYGDRGRSYHYLWMDFRQATTLKNISSSNRLSMPMLTSPSLDGHPALINGSMEIVSEWPSDWKFPQTLTCYGTKVYFNFWLTFFLTVMND